MDPIPTPCSCSSTSTPALRRAGSTRLSRRAVMAGGLALGAAPLVNNWLATAAAADSNLYNSPDLRTKLVRPMMFPIVPKGTGARVNRLRNYGDNRGSHIHAGEDMMAPKLSLLLACVDGIVIRKVYASSGNYLYLKGDDGYHYGYLHINNDTPGTDDGKNPSTWAFAPGINEGTRVHRGQQIAWVGDSGNAEGSGSHLHFEIRKPSSKWYWSQAIDPEPSLDAAAAAVATSEPADPTEPTTTTTTTPPAPPAAVLGPFAPFATATAFATQQSLDFLGRSPSSSWTSRSTRDLTRGSISPKAFVERMVNDPGVTGTVNPVIRLYQAYFGGIPTFEGVRYWVNAVRGGTSLDSVSAQMIASSKFKSTAGQLDNAGFARHIYVNLYRTQPSAKVVTEMKVMLDHGLARGALTRAVCESSQYRARSAHRTRVISVYHAMLRRSPAPSRLDHWAGQDARSRTGLQALIEAIRTGPDYDRRF